MLERILVGLDGSERAESILVRLAALLQRPGTELILARAVFVPPMASSRATAAAIEAEQREAQRYIDQVVARLAEDRTPARVRGVVCDGYAADVLLETARREEATLIALTTHGRSGVARWVFGSVAEKVVRASDRPVLVLRSFPEAPVAPLVVRRIIVPVDAGTVSLQIVPRVAEVARVFRASVLLVHVLEDPAALAAPIPEIRRAYEELRRAEVDVEPAMRKGDAAEEIVAACREHEGDMIAMTTHGRTGPARWLLGSVTERVIRTAGVPTLIVNARPVPIPAPAVWASSIP